jgi:hypothetical protein
MNQPKYNFNEKVTVMVKAESNGIRIEQEVDLYVVRISISSTSNGIVYYYGLSKCQAGPYAKADEIYKVSECNIIDKER